MHTKRIIPCLDVNNGRVVKGVNFVNIRDAGDPVEIAAFYNKEMADELVFLDITASYDARKIMADVVSRTADQVFIPLTVGGGIRTIEDFRMILKAGADKVSINSAALANPTFIDDAASRFGSSTVVVAIDAKRRVNHVPGYDVYLNGGRVNTGKDALEWAVEASRRGAGELLVTCMDTDGVKQGYDIELTSQIASSVEIPVIASGGAGAFEHFHDALTTGKADAALAASLFHYRDMSIKDVKQYLKERGVAVRL
ncbi:MAG: imidazole glycerol phosphate synthase subunit HisF [Clostridiales bacterium]|jgi:cyclase|nr:imidazole glycerol phosphate synthase subunit HisF [Clostridiales bacterium]